MNDNAKKDIRNNAAATGVSAVIGGAAGTAAATAIKGMTANAQEIETQEPASEPKPEPKPEHKPAHKPEPKPEPEKPEPVKPEPEKPEPEKPEPVKPEPEIEVLSYERVTNEDGSQSDIAVLNVDGHHAEVLDANIDGKADLLWVDLNDNQQIEEDEVDVVTGENIAMQPFQDASGYNPLYAQNDMPDYVNDADVDNFMA